MESPQQQQQPVLEVNLISAQGVKSPFTSNLRRRRLQTYAVAWVHPSTKLRTRVDRVGSENPMWNERFLFKVSPSFLSGETSSFTVEIYAVGVLTDTLIGSARILISNFLHLIPSSASHHHDVGDQSSSVALSTADFLASGGGVPAFSAVQIRRPSGRVHGVLNIAAMVVDGGSELVRVMKGAEGVRYRDLVKAKKLLSSSSSYGSIEDSWSEESSSSTTTTATDLSDGSESMTDLSDGSGSARILKEVNGRKERSGGSDGTVITAEKDGATVVVLCGLGLPRKIHISPSDENFRALFSTPDQHSKKTARD